MSRRLNIRTWLVWGLMLIGWSTGRAEENSFAGNWRTTFGPMQLKQDEDRVTGSYSMQGARCTIEGRIKEGRLVFTYREGDVAGEGWFELADDGNSFEGRWREAGTEEWASWIARRTGADVAPDEHVAKKGFGGLWSSTYGRMRLVAAGDEIQGLYSGEASLTGKVKDGRFEFRYEEPDAKGDGWFELADDGESLNGLWKADGASDWSDWTAKRIHADPGVRWLVVVEARWEADLSEREFAFGDMLKAFFDRAPNVQVRRRFFNDKSDLRRWCREVALLAEPVVLCIATHGTTEGIEIAGQTISPDDIADSLRYASNVQLLHFSACLMMKDQLAGRIMKQLGQTADFPISGYATSVDWAASAVIEFLYFDLVLARAMSPSQAAEQVKVLFPTAGDNPVDGAVLPPADFRILLPAQAAPASEATVEPNSETPK